MLSVYLSTEKQFAVGKTFKSEEIANKNYNEHFRWEGVEGVGC